MPGIELAFEISKDAMKLVKAGEAVISSGGVRMQDGSLFELAKPIAQAGSNNIPLNPLNLISSLSNNMQSVFIQRGVNKANRGINDLRKQGMQIIKDIDLIHADTLEIKRGTIAVMNELHDVNRGMDLLNTKADISLLQMNQLQSMVNGLQSLTWLSCAFGMLNCGISIVGFSQVLSKLSSISEQIEALDQKIGRNIMNDYREKFTRFYDQIRTDIQIIQNPDMKVSEKDSIPEHLNRIKPFLERINNEFMINNINNELALNVIFGLTNAFAQEVQFYSTRYLYEKGELPAAYDSWLKVIADPGQDEFMSKLETALSVEYMDLTLKEQKDIMDASALTSRLQLDNLVFCNLLTDNISENDFLNFDHYLARISSSAENFKETENGALLMIA